MANVVVDASVGGGLLNAWVDFDRDGIWEGGEQAFTDVGLNMGPANLSISVPAGASTGTT